MFCDLVEHRLKSMNSADFQQEVDRLNPDVEHIGFLMLFLVPFVRGDSRWKRLITHLLHCVGMMP